MKIKVKYAKLHTEYFSTGTGNLGTVLEAEVRNKGMVMLLSPGDGLYIEYKGVHFYVPVSNLAGCTFYKDPLSE